MAFPKQINKKNDDIVHYILKGSQVEIKIVALQSLKLYLS